MRWAPILIVTLLLGVLAGSGLAMGSVAGGPTDGISGDDVIGNLGGSDGDGPATVAEPAACDANATTEVVGCWKGIHHDADPVDLGLDANADAEGLTEEQLMNMTYLKMARIEAIRERPFESEVPVEVISREEFSEAGLGGDADEEFHRWNDQVWKALFVIGEDESSEQVINDVFAGAVAGYYSPSEDQITIVMDGDETIHVPPTTLLHELGHAMQDQYENLSDPRFTGSTQDADLGIDGIIEGEVVYMEEVYAERCGDDWRCSPDPPDNSATDNTNGDAADNTPEPNLGVLLTVLQPYSDGAPYVDQILEADGWEGVDDRMANPPRTTRETIHREPFDPVPIEFEDTAEWGWERYSDQGVNGSDTVGEASLFVSMWYQSAEYDASIMDRNDLFPDEDAHPYQMYNYAHPATAGWANDAVYPYRNDAGDEERDGYVWVTEWESHTDAAEFHAAYQQLLDAHDAERRSDGVQYVSEGRFRGAYGVERAGTTITIVHALEPEAIFELRPNIDLAEPETEPDTVTPPTDLNGDDDFWTPPETTPTGDGATTDDTPGFGVVVAVVGLLTVLVVARSRSFRRR